MASARKKSAGTELGFEDALSRVETVLSELESGGLGLDESMALFEEGVALLGRAEKRLKSAEGRLLELTKGENGELVQEIIGPLSDVIVEIDQ